MDGGSFSSITKITVWVLLGILGVSGLLLHGRLVSDLDRVGDNSGVESEQLAGLRDLLHGQPLYRNFANPPYLIRGYMPLFYLAPKFIAECLDASDSEAFLVARCYVYAFWLAVGLVVYWLARQVGCTKLFASLAAFLWMGGPLATQWANSYRPDAPALFFSLAAIALYQRASRPVHHTMVLLLLLAAFLHKQSAVSALIAILANEIGQKQYRRAAMLTCGWTASVAAAMAVGQLVTNGAFAINILGSLWGTCTWDTTLVLWEAAAIRGFVVLSGGAMSLIGRGWIKGARVLKVYFVVSCLLALLGTRKYGSYLNYFLESYAAGCVLTAALLQDWQLRSASRIVVRLRVVWLGLAVASGLYVVQPRLDGFPQWLHETINHRDIRRLQEQRLGVILNSLNGLGNPLLIEDPYLSLRQSPNPFVIDPKQFAVMQACGKFDDTRVLQMIVAGKFKAIIATLPLQSREPRRFPSLWIEPMRKLYVFVRRYDRGDGQSSYFVYQADLKPGNTSRKDLPTPNAN